MQERYLPRLMDTLLSELLADFSAVLLVGPRATGKTTTAARQARTVIRLDRPAEAEAFRADPDVALAGLPEPVLLDEWQVVPEVLGAVKRAVDADPRRGRFIVTGSVRADLQREGWPATGRLVRADMTGLTMREILHRDLERAPWLERLAEQGVDGLELPPDSPDLRGYVELAVRGGFPESVLRLSERTRPRWLTGYLDRLLTRDAMELGVWRDPVRLRRFFEAWALNTAGEVTDHKLLDTAGVDRRTGTAYEQLLRSLLVVDVLPAWSSNRLKRLVRTPKRYVCDPSLAAAVLGADGEGVLRDGDLLGRMIDTFVLAQLRAEVPLSPRPSRLYHLRQEGGAREVDLVAEFGARTLVAVEIKARSAVNRDAARHLIWLRDQLGEDFVAGVVLHTGPRIYQLDERIVAAPVATLWA
ncbi:MAG: ATP-binding protein [Egibacteraceae bacterium]